MTLATMSVSSVYRRECPPDCVVSFMPERFDGVEAGRSPRGEEAKDDADRGRKRECQRDDAVVERERERESARSGVGSGERERDADRSSEEREHDGFDQKLCQHVTLEGADRQPDADLS